MKIKRPLPPPLRMKARRGFRGYPIATIAFYGPTDSCATKVAVGIVRGDGEDPEPLERWYSETEDMRYSSKIGNEISQFIKTHGAKTVAITDRIIGCPHQVDIDYPRGEECPECPFWIGRDRWTGNYIQ